VILDLEIRHTDFDFLETTNDARASDGTRIPNESAIVRADVAPSVTKNLFVLLAIEANAVEVLVLDVLMVLNGVVVLVGILVDVSGTVVLVVLVAEVSVAEHSLDVGTNPLMGFPGQPVLPCW
jgi:hypothetical protein